VAVARTLLCIARAVMRYDGDYADACTDYYEQRDQRNREHLVRYHQHAWPASATRSPWPSPVTTARRQARAARQTQPRARPPDPQRTPLAGPRAGSADAAACLAGNPKFRHRR
jgi:hypothetical protein